MADSAGCHGRERGETTWRGSMPCYGRCRTAFFEAGALSDLGSVGAVVRRRFRLLHQLTFVLLEREHLEIVAS